MNYSSILVASHGTIGAKVAETVSIEMCAKGGKLHHLTVVPDFWRDMMGDDWLNSGKTRETYGRYIESELEKEINNNVLYVREATDKKGIVYSHEILIGKPTDCLLEVCNKIKVDLVVIGSPRPPKSEGLKSRINYESLAHKLGVLLLVVPYPCNE